jgi:proteasome lid subunit RPN8/RPN11
MDDVSFGEIQFSQPDSAVRPDQDPHYAVSKVGQPESDPLAIYVHVEAFRAMDLHASSDESIELGGVMLGGQYLDDEGRPFVVVRDILEAKHFEATRGSFKFTLDTWQDLVRQTNLYPEGTRIVGWYHSHPGWGIFLSEMDLFICRGFFNRPCDLAFVVDPCSDQRGWFHWQTLDNIQSKVKNYGYYLFDSRHRQGVLDRVARRIHEVEGGMSSKSINRGVRVFPREDSWEGGDGAVGGGTHLYLTSPSVTWLTVAVVSLLALQMLAAVMCLVWLVRMSPAGGEDSARATAVYESVISRMIEQSAPEDPPALTEERLRRLLDQEEQTTELQAQNRLLTLAGEAAREEASRYRRAASETAASLESLQADHASLQAKLQGLEAGKAQDSAGSGQDDGGIWTTILGASLTHMVMGILGIGLGVCLGGWWISRRNLLLDLDGER